MVHQINFAGYGQAGGAEEAEGAGGEETFCFHPKPRKFCLLEY